MFWLGRACSVGVQNNLCSIAKNPYMGMCVVHVSLNVKAE